MNLFVCAGVQENEQLINEMVKLVRDTIGPVAAFRKVLFVRELPKTRSGKIPRSSLADLVNGKPYKVRHSCHGNIVCTILITANFMKVKH